MKIICAPTVKTKSVIFVFLLASIVLLISFSSFAAAETPVPASPNFSIYASPSSFTDLAGTTQISTITLYSIARYNGTVNLSVTTTSTALTANLATSLLSVKYNLAMATSITMTISPSAASGKYNITVTGRSSDGTLVHSTIISITVIKPDFSITAVPSYFSVLAGTTQTSTIKVYSAQRFNGTVNLSSVNAGLTANFAASSVLVKYNESGATTMTVTVPSAAAAGNYVIVVTGKNVGGSLVHSVSITVQVLKPDYSMSASPLSFSVVAGTTQTSVIKVSPTQRFNGTVNLSSTNAGLAASFAASSVQVKYSESSTTTMTITVPASTVAGKYVLVVTGQTSGGLSHSVNITVQVIKPEYSISASPSYLTIASGQSAASQIRLYSLSRFNGTVSLTVQYPSGWTAPALNSASVTLSYNTNAVTGLTIAVPAQTSSGKYNITVTGQAAGITHITTLTVQVLNPSFSISASPSSTSIVSGTQATVSIRLYQNDRFNGSITLTASSPSGWNTGFSANPVWIDYAHIGTSDIKISVPAGTASETYTITVTATSGSLTRSVAVKIQVLNPNFNMYPSWSNMYLIAGTKGKVVLTLSPTNRFNGTITLTAQSPNGWTATFAPSPLAIDYAHSGKTELTISVPLGTFDGKYSIVATGTNGQTTHSVTVNVTIITPDISLQASPSLTTIKGGAAGNITISVYALGRYNGTITLSAAAPDGWATSFYKPTFTVAYNHTYDYSKMLVSVPVGTLPGKYNILVTANGDQLSLTDTISVTVLAK